MKSRPATTSGFAAPTAAQATSPWKNRWPITVTDANDPPTFNHGGDQTINEDAGAQTVNGFATGMDDGDTAVAQSLVFDVTNDNNGLFTAQPAIDANGVLTYTPAANQNGTAKVTVRLKDDGSNVAPNVNTSLAKPFTITVNAINDAPSFTQGADQSVLEDAGAQTVAGWATAITDGDPELAQTLAFNITANDNPTLFSAGPRHQCNDRGLDLHPGGQRQRHG